MYHVYIWISQLTANPHRCYYHVTLIRTREDKTTKPWMRRTHEDMTTKLWMSWYLDKCEPLERKCVSCISCKLVLKNIKRSYKLGGVQTNSPAFSDGLEKSPLSQWIRIIIQKLHVTGNKILFAYSSQRVLQIPCIKFTKKQEH